ncbi:MAG: methionyl-tRNA formyltransferase [Chlamydiia bacterium]|nr:methionyl-tRNA formyltransferase [Chlamydiia bacterium]MCP5509314.1 methionyl-tRNA formyltransferase [Chlamydiales bacterium]HPE85149.1 methionyl-tRNA formyltransferase [Chlamydiales bacterium]
MRVVFFGTPTYAEHILSYLIDSKIEIVAIVTRPDKPKGRARKMQSPPVKLLAQKLLPNVPIFQPSKASTPEFTQTLQEIKADLFVVVAYGEIIKQFLLDIPPLGCINVHFSLLPRWRGAAPMQHALLAGDKETGVSIIRMVLAMDAGDILGQEKIAIPESMTCGELAQKLCQIAGPLLVQVIKELKDNKTHPVQQDPRFITMAPKITPESARIDWDQNAADIHNKIRALNPHPGAWCEVEVGGQIKRLKILRSEIHLANLNQYSKEGWFKACGHGTLKLLEVQLEGKRAMSTKEFISGVSQIKFIN